MKIKSNLFYRSFLLSFIIFTLLAAVFLTFAYIDAGRVRPDAKQSNILVGVTDENRVISLNVVNINPQDSQITFLAIPDNTWISDNVVLQHLYNPNDMLALENNIEALLGIRLDRYLMISLDALEELTDEMGEFAYSVNHPFEYRGKEYSGMIRINGKIAKAMLSYEDYDLTNVSLSEISLSYLQSFLSAYLNETNIFLLEQELIESDIHTSLTDAEIEKYSSYLKNYSALSHRTIALEGEKVSVSEGTSKRSYFIPKTTNSHKNIFRK